MPDGKKEICPGALIRVRSPSETSWAGEIGICIESPSALVGYDAKVLFGDCHEIYFYKNEIEIFTDGSG